MASANTIFKKLLNVKGDVLKGEFGLDGFVVSDANAIRECVTHGIAEDDRDAGVKAALAGMDMDMGTHIYKDYLKAEVEKARCRRKSLTRPCAASSPSRSGWGSLTTPMCRRN